jgi:hypothetical protein
MVFLLLVEFTCGSLLVLCGCHVRGLVTRGFLKMCVATALVSAVFAVWIGFSLGRPAEVGGYPLDNGFLNPVRVLLVVVAALTAVYAALVWQEAEPGGRVAGGIAAAAALAALGLTAAIFRLPAWGYAGVLLSLVAGSLSLGAVTLGMVLGHWYLVTPRLPEQPLNEVTAALIGVLIVQALLVFINLAIPVREVPTTDAVGLAQNPAFWLRIGVGLLFPIVLALMAWRSSVERGMMSATGLLYIATGAVLAGEALARGLQFITAIPF